MMNCISRLILSWVIVWIILLWVTLPWVIVWVILLWVTLPWVNITWICHVPMFCNKNSVSSAYKITTFEIFYADSVWSVCDIFPLCPCGWQLCGRNVQDLFDCTSKYFAIYNCMATIIVIKLARSVGFWRIKKIRIVQKWRHPI